MTNLPEKCNVYKDENTNQERTNLIVKIVLITFEPKPFRRSHNILAPLKMSQKKMIVAVGAGLGVLGGLIYTQTRYLLFILMFWLLLLLLLLLMHILILLPLILLILMFLFLHLLLFLFLLRILLQILLLVLFLFMLVFMFLLDQLFLLVLLLPLMLLLLFRTPASPPVEDSLPSKMSEEPGTTNTPTKDQAAAPENIGDSIRSSPEFLVYDFKEKRYKTDAEPAPGENKD